MTDARSMEDLQQAARRHWRQVALSTKPIDKASAAAAVEAVYTAATGRPPAHILFFDSPLQAEIAGTFLTFNHPGQLLRRDRGRPQVSRVVRESIEAAGPLPPGVADDYGRQLANPVRAALTAAYHAGPDRTVF